MQWFYNLKIAAKLLISFIILAVIAGLVGIVGIINISNINEADTKLYHLDTLGIQYVGDASQGFQRLRYNTLMLTVVEDPTIREQTRKTIDNLLLDIEESLNNYNKYCITDDADQAASDLAISQWEQYRAYIQQYDELVDTRNYDRAKQIILVDADSTGDDLRDSLDSITIANAAHAKATSESNDDKAQTAFIMMIIVIGIGIVLAVALGIFISRIISKPINKIVEAANKLALGDVMIDVEANTTDEIGSLASSFKDLIASTREQSMVAERIASGDLTVDATARSDKDLLGNNIVKLVNNLNDNFADIAAASEQVASGSKQVSDSSIALSQGATEQASSIEELTASLEEISSQTKQNADKADKANLLAENARKNAVQGNSQMKEMLKAMDEINESSSNINKIIKVIDDIAFQTNILALNAAVEAARAGQHGKGFAVVAEEVRTLAARSANAAKETTDLIEGSIKKVEAGTKIANDTAEALGIIVNQVENAANLVKDIAAASNEQAVGIEQINQGIMQVSEVVQTNSATSEESAAASEELLSQADMLREMVGKLKLKKKGQSSSKLDNLSPEVLKMLENMVNKNTETKQQAYTRKEIRNEKRISLSDKDFGKY